MNDSEKKILSYVAAYIILAFLTFGYAWNHPSAWDIKCETGELPVGSCGPNPRGAKSVLAGIVWPIWGTGTLAIAVTKWP